MRAAPASRLTASPPPASLYSKTRWNKLSTPQSSALYGASTRPMAMPHANPIHQAPSAGHRVLTGAYAYPCSRRAASPISCVHMYKFDNCKYDTDDRRSGAPASPGRLGSASLGALNARKPCAAPAGGCAPPPQSLACVPSASLMRALCKGVHTVPGEARGLAEGSQNHRAHPLLRSVRTVRTPPAPAPTYASYADRIGKK